jgi:hypothetical protein
MALTELSVADPVVNRPARQLEPRRALQRRQKLSFVGYDLSIHMTAPDHRMGRLVHRPAFGFLELKNPSPMVPDWEVNHQGRLSISFENFTLEHLLRNCQIV